MDRLLEMLQKMQLPFAYDHFAEGEAPQPPFLCYLLPGSNNFSADGKVYFKVNEVRIELYTDVKDLSAEQAVEAVLDQYGLFYDKTETWIESEKLYEVLYFFELEA
ncbi:hypothetical protein LI221_08135 [Faecalimonas umbilicata]|nr:hypothetical protein [Faecalimonas umbilicata]